MPQMFKLFVNATNINALIPHDALKHHFTSLKTDLIFLQLRVLERQFPCNWFINTWQFSLIFRPLQVIFIHSACSGWDDNGKFRLERVNYYGFGTKFVGFRSSRPGVVPLYWVEVCTLYFGLYLITWRCFIFSECRFVVIITAWGWSAIKSMNIYSGDRINYLFVV